MQPLIIIPKIFNSNRSLACGISTKIGAFRKAPFYFNLSLNVGDDEKIVKENREVFFQNLGLASTAAAFQNQIHSDVITYIDTTGICGQSDAMITDVPGIALCVTIADCTPILIYDEAKKIISAVHSGWRGTYQKILLKTISKLIEDFHCDPASLICYIGPSISQINYEVDLQVAEKFPAEFSVQKDNKYLLDVSGINFNYLLASGVKKSNIQKSKLCTFAYHDIFHSYRRDGKTSGRSLAVIYMKDNIGRR